MRLKVQFKYTVALLFYKIRVFDNLQATLMPQKIIRNLRNSASVIIATRNTEGLKEEYYNYSLLLCKRTPQISTFRDHCVFPGGACDAADSSPAWLDYLSQSGINQAHLNKLICNSNKAEGLDIFKHDDKLEIPRYISLRITALRETFEEVGVLLCRPKLVPHHMTANYAHYKANLPEKAHWQRLVHADATQFLNLCRHLDVVPDLWSLCEWSLWRSGSSTRKRYDTIYYIVALEDQPQLLLQADEVAAAMWYSPAAVLQNFKNEKIWLPPLLFYEISRLTHMLKLQDLIFFSHKRQTFGLTLLTLVYHQCTDAKVAVLIGDELYPTDGSIPMEDSVVGIDYRTLQTQAQRRHRLIMRDFFDMFVDLTIPPLDGHLSPVAVVLSSSSSKL